MKSKSNKRANGEGTLYQRKDSGTWIGELLVDGRTRRVSGKTKAAAASKLRELVQLCESGRVPADSQSVRQLVELWQRVELPTLTRVPASVLRIEGQCRTIVEHLGSERLALLTPEMVEGMYDELHRRRGNSEATLQSLRSTLRQILHFGMRRDRVDRNVAEISKVPAVGSTARLRVSLDEEQSRTLWAACVDHRLGELWQTQIITGVRPGEAAGLVWSSIDLDADVPTLTLSHTVRIDKRGAAFLGEGVKTNGSFRTLAVPPPLVPVLRRRRAAAAADALAAGRPLDPAALVFPSEAGTVLGPGNVRRAFDKLLAEHDLPAIGPNELRHTAASLMYDAGMSLDEIAGVLGHSSTRMLEQRYRHRLRPVRSEHVAAMSAAFG